MLVICQFRSEYEHWQSLGDGYRVEAEFVLWEEENTLQVVITSYSIHYTKLYESVSADCSCGPAPSYCSCS